MINTGGWGGQFQLAIVMKRLGWVRWLIGRSPTDGYVEVSIEEPQCRSLGAGASTSEPLYQSRYITLSNACGGLKDSLMKS